MMKRTNRLIAIITVSCLLPFLSLLAQEKDFTKFFNVFIGTGAVDSMSLSGSNFPDDVSIKTLVAANSISGNGTVLYDLASGSRTYVIPTTTINSNFTGTNIINAGVRLHASDGNLGYPLGNGGVVNATAAGSQIWLDRSATNYNQAFELAGNGFTDGTAKQPVEKEPSFL